ncbi:MAG: LapA family protein [Bauldia sp.]|nr:LapA family protein [Bauldia sp.]
MGRAARLLLIVPVAVVVVLVAIANRHPVVFSVDPLGETAPGLSVEVPLYWILFAALALGILIGGAATWVGQSKWRRMARHDHSEVERLRREAQRPPAAASLSGADQRRPVA